MFLKLTEAFGKPVCALLWGLFAALAARKKPLPLLLLSAMHLGEYFAVGRRIAAGHGVSVPAGLAQCLGFGFTWWLPLKKAEK